MDGDAWANQDPNEGAPEEEAPVGHDLDQYLTDEYDYQAPRHGDIRTGVVVEVNDQGAVMDIGSKREGFVPAEDLTRLDEETRQEVQIGATMPAFVVRSEDQDGRPVLSIHRAHLYQDWLKAEQMMENDELYEGEVSGHNRGGLIVRFGKIRGFIPASQVVGLPRRLREEQRNQRLAAMVGQRIGLRVIEVDRRRRRLIFSQRRALRAWQELQRERVMAHLTEGETRHGKVTSLTDFGAFVDLGGADGLVHVSELSWRRVDHPRQVLGVGDEVDVYVLSVDRERKRIALSIKKLQPNPWTLVDDHYTVGQLVEGRVTRILEFGAFLELDLGVEGLLHAREMIGTPELSPAEVVQPGETLPVKVIRIDSSRRRLDLSARQVQKDEWERWMAERQMAREEEEPTAEEEVTAVEAEALASEPAQEETTPPEEEALPAESIDEENAAREEAATAGPAEEEIETQGEEPAAAEAAQEETTPPEEEAPPAESIDEEDTALEEAATAGPVEEEIETQVEESSTSEAVEVKGE